MSVHVGYVVEVKQLRPHSNADRLQIATFFGVDTCVGLDVKVGDLGVYFPCDLQLSEEFAEKNNLVRKKDAEGNNIGGYMDPDKRNVTAIRLRGEKSEGVYMDITCLDYCYNSGAAADNLGVGDTIDIVNGHEICKKYIPTVRNRSYKQNAPKVKGRTLPIAPLFAEHADTEQLRYNISAFKSGHLVEITLKMHGTSGRTGYLPRFTKFKRTFWDKVFRREGTPVYDWGIVSGTRRVVLNDFNGGFYGSNDFRKPHSDFFEGKLLKGETVYYEIVGFTDNGTPIMGDGNNSKLNDKEFIKKYGPVTRFSYGCSEKGEGGKPQSDIYVYRMTMTNEDGYVVEYTPDFMRFRCEQMGVKTVPLFETFIIPEMEDVAGYVLEKVEKYVDGTDPVGKTHIREGVVARIVNAPEFTAYKDKNFNFKVIEGIIKDSADAPDMEEAQDVE